MRLLVLLCIAAVGLHAHEGAWQEGAWQEGAWQEGAWQEGAWQDSLRHADDSVRRAALVRAVDAELSASLFTRTIAAVEISDAVSGEILYERNAGLLLRPASTAKLFTLAASLLTLPESGAFSTELFATERGAGAHDLWVRGSGDPLLTVEDIQNLARSVHDAGIRSIGALYADCTMYDSLPWGRGWMWDDAADPSMPVMSPLTVNEGRIDVTVRASRGRHPAVRVRTSPALACIPVASRVAVRRRSDVRVTDVRVTRDPSSNRIRVDGCIAAGDSVTSSVAMWHPAAVTAALLLIACREQGISVSDTAPRFAPVPEGSWRVGVLSRPLQPVLNSAGQHSDNIAAEALLRALASSGGRRGVSAEDGLAELRRVLQQRSVDSSDIALVDGSGLSFYNLVTVRVVGRLLRMMRGERQWPSFVTSLARPGASGTLANRMRRLHGAEWVHAKTGTISGVSSLAGYVIPPQGSCLTFVIFFQNFSGSHRAYRMVQDRIVARCIEFSAPPGAAKTLR